MSRLSGAALTQRVQRADGVVFNVEDVVKVIKCPRPDQMNHLIDTLGYVGVIEEFTQVKGEHYTLIQCLDGNGSGAIPLDCLEHASAPEGDS